MFKSETVISKLLKEVDGIVQLYSLRNIRCAKRLTYTLPSKEQRREVLRTIQELQADMKGIDGVLARFFLSCEAIECVLKLIWFYRFRKLFGALSK